MTPIPFNDLRRQAAAETAARVEVTRRVLQRGWYVLGPETEAFEHAFAERCRVAGCATTGNGTDALEIALRAAGVAPHDEVVMVANAGMYATVACLAIGATPVFADVDAATLLLDPERVEPLVSERTRAIVVTHLYGNVVDVDRVRSIVPPDVRIVEDCAQAHGASLRGRPVGSLGDVAAFSFYPTKNLGALGDAGAVVSDDEHLLDRARALRQYGWESRYVASLPGGRNSRMDELQAALLLHELPKLDERNDRRRAIHDRYVRELADRLPVVDARGPDVVTVAHLCVARHERRDEVLAALADRGVAGAVHYPLPDHRQPALAAGTFRHEGLDETDRACREVLSLPCFPELDDDEVTTVITAVGACA